jgi:hypothetical protein
MDILGFKVTAAHTGTVPHFPHHPNDKYPHDRFLVKIKRDNKQISFHFFGSYDNYMKYKTYLDAQDLVDVFYSFLSAAEVGTRSFDDFLSEFSRKADKNSKAIYQATVTARDKAFKLGLFNESIYDLINELQSEYGV